MSLFVYFMNLCSSVILICSVVMGAYLHILLIPKEMIILKSTLLHALGGGRGVCVYVRVRMCECVCVCV